MLEFPLRWNPLMRILGKFTSEPLTQILPTCVLEIISDTIELEEEWSPIDNVAGY